MGLEEPGRGHQVQVLASTVSAGLFSSAVGAHCPAVPGELLEPNRRVTLDYRSCGLASVTLGYLRAVMPDLCSSEGFKAPSSSTGL